MHIEVTKICGYMMSKYNTIIMNAHTLPFLLRNSCRPVAT
jgi:hypothetical protein